MDRHRFLIKKSLQLLSCSVGVAATLYMYKEVPKVEAGLYFSAVGR